jgi:hypothetical protein
MVSIPKTQKIRLNFKEDGSLGWKGHSMLAGATVGIAGLATICIIAAVSILRQTPQAFQPIESFATAKLEAQSLWEKGIKSKDSFAQAQKKIGVHFLDSGGTKFNIYAFGVPETCGTLGCLYVAVDQITKEQIPLQLSPLLSDKQMFKPLPVSKSRCFTVDQKSNTGRIESYEICPK